MLSGCPSASASVRLHCVTKVHQLSITYNILKLDAKNFTWFYNVA